MIELTVVLAILGLLFSLTATAVQSARAAARRTQCRSNLRQLALACHDHVAVHGTFPSNFCAVSKNPRRPGDGLRMYCRGYLVGLLPHIGAEPFFRRYDERERASGNTDRPPVTFSNQSLVGVTLPLFLCPDDSAADLQPGGTNYRASTGAHTNTAVPVPHGAELLGLFSLKWSIRPEEASDGLSNTALLCERLVGDGDGRTYSPARDTLLMTGLDTLDDVERRCPGDHEVDDAGVPRHDSHGGGTWLFGGIRSTGYNHLFTPNTATPDCGRTRGTYAARSFHPGGVNLALGDGSVRFVANDVDLTVWRAVGTAAGGEPVGAW